MALKVCVFFGFARSLILLKPLWVLNGDAMITIPGCDKIYLWTLWCNGESKSSIDNGLWEDQSILELKRESKYSFFVLTLGKKLKRISDEDFKEL
jgi:hypothetical protein